MSIKYKMKQKCPSKLLWAKRNVIKVKSSTQSINHYMIEQILTLTYLLVMSPGRNLTEFIFFYILICYLPLKSKTISCLILQYPCNINILPYKSFCPGFEKQYIPVFCDCSALKPRRHVHNNNVFSTLIFMVLNIL